MFSCLTVTDKSQVTNLAVLSSGVYKSLHCVNRVRNPFPGVRVDLSAWSSNKGLMVGKHWQGEAHAGLLYFYLVTEAFSV